MATKEYNVITRTRAARSRSSGSAQSLGRQTATLITGGYTSATSGGSDGHSHGNKELLDALHRDDEKYVYLREYDRTAGEDGDGDYVSEKVKAGYADKSGETENSKKWNSKEMVEMLDQPVRTDDDVKHKSVTASGAVKGKVIEGESLAVEKDATVGGTATAQRVVAHGDVEAPRLTTPTFRGGGLTGEGGGMYTDETGLTHAEYDYIVARRGLVLSTLIIEEINSVAGGIVASKAHGEVEEISANTADDGLTRYAIILKDVNMFQLNDLVRFAQWDYTNNSYRWAWVPVRGCDTETRVINIWASDLTEGMSLPEVGDKLVLMGNTTDKTRQGFVYIIDSGIQCFDGVNSASLEGKCRGVFGDLSNITDNGKTLSGYGVWTDNLFLGSNAEEAFKELINIGGRNYALGTGEPFVNNSISTTASDWQDMRMYYAKGLKTGDVVNVSFDWTAVGANSSTINKIKVQLGYGSETSINKYQGGDELEIYTSSGTYNSQLTIPSGVTEDTTIHVRLQVLSNSVTSINVSHLMLQKGQGDWNIAPEDLNNALTEYKSVVESEFAVTNQGLTSVQRSVTQLIDGSRNLLLNTNQGATGWYASSVYSVGGVKGEYTTFTREAYSTEKHYELFCFALRPELIEEGKQYLLSFEVYLPEDYDNVGNVAMFTALASPSFTDVLSYNTNERNNQKTQIGSWVKMEYVITANASGAKDDTTSIYISIARADYNKLQYFYIRNLQMLERTSDSTIAVTDDEFLPWRPAIEDATNYADTLVDETKETLIQQTNEAIALSATETKQYADGKIDDAKAEIKVTTDSITQSVSDLRTDVDGDIAGLESEIKQTADSISLKVKEFGISNLNYAYGTGKAVEIKTLNNINNQTVALYSVTGLSAKDIVSLSFVIRIKDVIFDTQNNAVDARLTFQLDNNFGYRGFGVYLRLSDFDDITADANGYKTLKITAKGIDIPQYGYNSTTEITPDVVGKIVMRLDYIDSEVDEDGNDIGVIEISELKIEKGDECTDWTSRTQDMDTALLDAGIDIGNKQIVATTDKFIIQNKLGQITASVDEDGNLATGTVLCWNTDETTKDATPYLTTLNRKGNGFLEFFYPLAEDNGNSNLAFQIGWDGESKSVFRFYTQEGTIAWIAGDYTGFLKDTTSEIIKTITEEKFHDTGTTDLATAKTYVQNTRNLSANITLYKVVTQDANGVTSYYATDKEGNNKVSSGIYTLTGTPQLGIKPSGATGNYYSRTLYVANTLTPGVFMQYTHQWEVSTSTNTDIITP